MSREIKFRAWLPGISKMTHAHTLDELMNWNTDKKDNGTAVWLQYTGLKDKNGVEIYEGDVVSARPQSSTATFTGYVHFINAQYFVNYIGYESYYMPLIQLHSAEYEPIRVVGNIHEHPNLLQKE